MTSKHTVPESPTSNAGFQTPSSQNEQAKSLRRGSIVGDVERKNEEIKAKIVEFDTWTKYEMVQDVELEHDGEYTERKVLFMPNKYVSRFNARNIDQVIINLGLGERTSNFVITLLPSLMGAKDFEVTPQSITGSQNLGEQVDYADKRPPSHAKGDELVTETQTMLFVKHCILPVAKKARALIIISATNDCSLAVAVQNIMGPIQTNMGEKCPFTIVGYCSMENIYHSIGKEEKEEDNQEEEKDSSGGMLSPSPSPSPSLSLAGNICSSAKKLNKEDFFDHLNKAAENETNSKQRKFLLQHSRDINPICTRIILFEGIKHDGANPSFDDRSRPFMNLLLEHLDDQYPSLAVQA